MYAYGCFYFYERSDAPDVIQSRLMPRRIPEVYRSLPSYPKTSEATVVNLAEDGISCIPVLGDTHYSRSGGGTVPHVHPGMIEILCCRRGADLSFDYGGTVYPFRPGDVFVAQPEVPHFLQRYPKSLAMHWLWFKLPSATQTVLGLSGAETRWLVSRLRALPAAFAAGEPVKRAFNRLWQLYQSVPPRTVERRLLLRDAALHLLLRLVDTSRHLLRAPEDDTLDAVIAEMRDSPAADYPIEVLMRRTAMSAPTLTALFRRRTGLPPHAYLVACRIAKAKDALAKSRQEVSAIARQLGFPSSQYFATQFKRETGLSPRDWRRQNKQSKGQDE